MATVAVGDVSLPPANPEQTQTEKAPRVGVNLLGLVPLVKKLFKKKSVPLETPEAVPAPSPESTPCAFNPVVFEIEVRETAGGPVLETHQVRANGECSWHNVSEKLKFAEERYITVKTMFLDPACTRDAYYDNIRIRVMDIPEVLQQNHYYPFGMNMTGIEEDDQQTLSSLEENMYQYNGKEKDLSLGLHWHDYGARQYDAQLGRWNGVDPLAEKYLSYSSYNYVMNNPIMFVDPDGREINVYYQDSEGKEQSITWKEGMKSDTGNDFADKTIKALNHLAKNSVGTEVMSIFGFEFETGDKLGDLADGDYEIKIRQTTETGAAVFIPNDEFTSGGVETNGGTINWNPEDASTFISEDGTEGTHSPALILWHELGEAHIQNEELSWEESSRLQGQKNKKYGDELEKKNILENEHPAAEKLGLKKRAGHGTTGHFKVSDPTKSKK